MDATLVPVPVAGQVSVDSNPAGAQLYIDGNFEGVTPLVVSGLSRGDHRVVLHALGYSEFSTLATVNAGETTTLSLDLTQVGSPETLGFVGVNASQPGTQVYLDKMFRGTTSPGLVFPVIGVDPGLHVLVLRNPGFEDYNVTVEVVTGHITLVDAVLVPAQLPPATGNLFISSSPTGALVYVDGTFRGIAPVMLGTIPAGPHRIDLAFPGYPNWTATVRVGGDQVVQVLGAAIPGPQQTPAKKARCRQ